MIELLYPIDGQIDASCESFMVMNENIVLASTTIALQGDRTFPVASLQKLEQIWFLQDWVLKINYKGVEKYDINYSERILCINQKALETIGDT